MRFAYLCAKGCCVIDAFATLEGAIKARRRDHNGWINGIQRPIIDRNTNERY